MNFDSTGNLRVNVECTKATYSQTIILNPICSGANMIVGLWGTSGGGRVVRVQEIELKLMNISGSYYQEVWVEMYTSGFAQSGYPQIVSGCMHDPSDSPSSGNLVFWSGIPLSGGWGRLGLLGMKPVLVTPTNWVNVSPFTASGLTVPDVHDMGLWSWVQAGIKEPTLRNAYQGCVVNLNSGVVPAGIAGAPQSGVRVRCRFTWTEETNLT